MENKALLPLALSYLDRGYSVIPVGLDKRPLVSWKEFQARKASVDELVGWFGTFPDAQIGIVTGKISNLTVIDVESDGDFNLIKDETYVVKTGGGGRHYYFLYDEAFKNAVRILPSVDVRSEGGYVVASGSETQKGVYTVIREADTTKMSSETRSMFTGAFKRQLDPSTPEVLGESLYPRTSTDGLDYFGTGEGNRNDSMTKFAGSIHAKLHSSLWQSIGWQLFESANSKNIPPLPRREMRLIWESISSREITKNPSGRTFNSRQPRVWGEGAPGSSWGSEERKREMNISTNISEDVETDAEYIDPKETLHVSDVASSQIIDSDHTYSLEMPPIDEALLGGFTVSDLVVVAGQSGHGKTTLIQNWTVTLAMGGGEKKDPLPVLWFSYEVLAKPLWQNFQKMGATEETPIYMPRFNETGDTEWVIDVIEGAIKKWGIKVVAIDHLGFLRAPKGNYSNAADAVTHTVRALKRLAVKHGLIIMLPVHVRKTSAKTPDLNDIRDSLGIAQEADTVFFISREKDSSGNPLTKAKLWLVKNRKSGISVSATFDFSFGRYFYNENTYSNRFESVSGSNEGVEDT